MVEYWKQGTNSSHLFDSTELKEAKQMFTWAKSYERKGLKVVSDALQDEGRKAMEQFLKKRTVS